jgi:protein-disulfide isomerase
MEKNSSTIFVVGVIVVSLGLLGALVLSRQGQPTSVERDLIDMAEELGLDGDQFFEDYQSEELRNEVDANVQAGIDRGVNATPTTFINGRQVQIAGTYDEFSSMVAAELNTENVEPPVLVEVYEDYQCPFCAQFFPFPYLLEAEFGADVEVIHHHMPLDSIHPLARRYAYAAEAARKQGAYVAYSTAIFTKESGTDYSQYAEILVDGLNEPLTFEFEEGEEVDDDSESSTTDTNSDSTE